MFDGTALHTYQRGRAQFHSATSEPGAQPDADRSAARATAFGKLGVAVSTAVPAVGGICPFIEAGIGAIASQSWVNPYLGIDGLKLLREGLSAREALDRLIAEDPGRDAR